MREKLNNNPLAQVVILGVLLVAVGFFVLSSMGGGGDGGESATETTATATESAPTISISGTPESATQVAGPPPGAIAKEAPPPPDAVTSAFADDKTVVLLFVRNGGIDDRIVARSVDRLEHSLPDAATFVVPAKRIARYAAITQGVSVNRVPALVVLRPKRLGHQIPTASVSYGFQDPQSIVQAVVDAGYKGPTVDYHP